MLDFVLFMVVMGGIVGAVAQLLAPGRSHLVTSVILAMVGSFAGGLLGWARSAPEPTGGLRTAGMLGSIGGAILTIALWRAVSHGRRTGWSRVRNPHSRSPRHHLY